MLSHKVLQLSFGISACSRSALNSVGTAGYKIASGWKRSDVSLRAKLDAAVARCRCCCCPEAYGYCSAFVILIAAVFLPMHGHCFERIVSDMEKSRNLVNMWLCLLFSAMVINLWWVSLLSIWATIL